MKNIIRYLLSENLQFLEVKYSIYEYLNRRAFVMWYPDKPLFGASLAGGRVRFFLSLSSSLSEQMKDGRHSFFSYWS